MKEVSTIGLDLAKNVFQVHGIDGSGETVVRRQLRRGQVLPFFKKLPPCLAIRRTKPTTVQSIRFTPGFGRPKACTETAEFDP
jgi:hypothetical protein